MKLEDLRGLQVGDVGMLVENAYIPAAFHHHAQVATWHTVQSILRLAGATPNSLADEKIGIVEWWRTIESLIALIHLVAVTEHGRGLRPHVSPPARPDASVLRKWASIARWFSEGTHSAPSWLTGVVTELRDFRNSFEHSTRSAARPRPASRLAEAPATANLADLMEAMAICEAAAQFVRRTIRGVDLMPQVFVPSHEHAMFEPLDVVAREALFPLLKTALSSRGLSTRIEPYKSPGRLAGVSVIGAAIQVRTHDVRPLPDVLEPIDAVRSLNTWAKGRPALPGPDEFRVPAYNFEERPGTPP